MLLAPHSSKIPRRSFSDALFRSFLHPLTPPPSILSFEPTALTTPPLVCFPLLSPCPGLFLPKFPRPGTRYNLGDRTDGKPPNLGHQQTVTHFKAEKGRPVFRHQVLAQTTGPGPCVVERENTERGKGISFQESLEVVGHKISTD